ncbi:unnamed protein product, partial [Discosporangium mesarthrocarpum]
HAKSKLKGWTVKVHKGPKYMSHSYIDPDGKEFKTKGEVLAAVDATGSGQAEFRKESAHQSREAAIARARKLLMKRGADLVGNREGAPPVLTGDMFVEDLGTIDPRAPFHSPKYIYPTGYSALKVVMDARQQRAVDARCSILDKDDAPLFRIEILGMEDDEGGIEGLERGERDRDKEAGSAGKEKVKGRMVEGGTQKEAWGQVFKKLGTFGSGREKESVLGGPNFFNLTVRALVEGMSGSDKCSRYVFLGQRGEDGGGVVPKKELGRGGRTTEDLRIRLEKSWWKGMPEEDKAKLRSKDKLKHAKARKRMGESSSAALTASRKHPSRHPRHPPGHAERQQKPGGGSTKTERRGSG